MTTSVEAESIDDSEPSKCCSCSFFGREDFRSELETYLKLSDPDGGKRSEKIKSDYSEAYTMITVVAALMSGFTLSLLCAPIELEDDVTGGIPREDTIWGDDAWETGRDVYYFCVYLSMILSILELLISMQLVLQLGQCPESVVEQYILEASSSHHFPFWFLAFGIVGFMISGTFLASLVLKSGYFIVSLVIVLLLVPLMLYHLSRTASIRKKVMEQKK